MTAQQPFPAEGADDPAHTGESDGEGQSQREDQGDDQGQSEGQVSEVQRLDEGDAETPISPTDSTAGYPPSESGDADTRGSGPDAAPPENRRDNEMDKQDQQLGGSVEDESL